MAGRLARDLNGSEDAEACASDPPDTCRRAGKAVLIRSAPGATPLRPSRFIPISPSSFSATGAQRGLPVSENENSNNGGDAVAEGRTPRQKPQRAAADRFRRAGQQHAWKQRAESRSRAATVATTATSRRLAATTAAATAAATPVESARRPAARPRPRTARSSRRPARSAAVAAAASGGYQQNYSNVDEEYDESKNGGGNGPLIDLNELKRKSRRKLLDLAEVWASRKASPARASRTSSSWS